MNNNVEIAEVCLPGKINLVTAGTPHLLYFDEDSVIVEWWNKDYIQQKYEPFYSRKNNK